MKFYVNGELIDYNGNGESSLLKFLRNDLNLISPKDGCSGEGTCGACSVLIDGKSINSCTMQMKRMEGKRVITIEGFDQYIKDVFSYAFLKSGGIQCGFCIPGIVISAKALLEKNLHPTRNDVKKAIHKNICRCTGYKKVIDSIMLTAAILRGEEDIRDEEDIKESKVGGRLPKYDCADKVLGISPFVADIKMDDMLFGVLKFSDNPRAKILKIDVEEASRLDGVVKIFTAEDFPGERVIGLIYQDWPAMIKVGEVTRYIGDVLAGVVAESEEIARLAVSKIKVEYEVLKPITTVDQAKKKNASCVQPHMEDNLLSDSLLKRGDVSTAKKCTRYTAKGTFFTPRIEHAFLETECALAHTEITDDGVKKVRLYSQGQGAYEDRKQVAKLLGMKLEDVEVIQVPNGGGFGGKEDLTVQGHAALFAYTLNHPVQVKLNRSESMMMHPKRHPMRLKYEVGCDENGIFTYLIAKIDGDSGAYASVGMKVLERAAGHAAGAYAIDNMFVRACGYYTNNVPCGAMRGFGVNQTAFAIESLIDELCEKGGNKGNFDRWQFRYNNALDVGKMTSTGQVIKGGIGLKDTLLAVKNEFTSAKYAGIACGIKNTGIGNGMPDIGEAKIVIEDIDHIIIYHGWTEMGQGVHTMAVHTVCEELGISPDIIEVRVDTRSNTVCGMTTSSRGTSLVAHALISACKKIKDDLKHYNIHNNDFSKLTGKEYFGKWEYHLTSEIGEVKPEVGHETHYSYSYATQVVILNNDGTIKKVIAAHDAGKIMNRTLFEGQIEGSVHMGLGYAISENLPMKDGFLVSDKYRDLKILRAMETPDVEVIGVESIDLNGPYGAKGVGEIGLVPTAGALVNALYTFDKKRRYSLPLGINKNFKK